MKTLNIKILIPLIFAFLIKTNLLCQSNWIYGYVTDAQNDSLIRGADLVVFLSDGRTYETNTDDYGRYNFKKVIDESDSIIVLMVTAKNYLKEKTRLSTDSLSPNNKLNFQMTPLIVKSYLPVIYFQPNSSQLVSNDFAKMKFISGILADNQNLDIDLFSYFDSRVENKELSILRASIVKHYIAVDSLSRNRIFITDMSDTISEIRFSLRFH